jgi:hypothetical protein
MSGAFMPFDDFDAPLWGADEIAPVIRRTVKATYYLLERGAIDATKVNGRWQSTKRRLLAPLASSPEAA